jgi:hypothetical protein
MALPQLKRLPPDAAHGGRSPFVGRRSLVLFEAVGPHSAVASGAPPLSVSQDALGVGKHTRRDGTQ